MPEYSDNPIELQIPAASGKTPQHMVARSLGLQFAIGVLDCVVLMRVHDIDEEAVTQIRQVEADHGLL